MAMILLKYGVILIIACICTPMVHAQVYPNSPVFREYRPEKEKKDSRNEGLRTQINVFLLERDAANGDPLAQHELGVRLLTGNGIAADTAKSAFWLQQAAAQSLSPAMYNYALLLNNGWGVEWDPFSAYRFFRSAADRGMTEAQFVTGVFFTDNLVLKQSWDSAWTWMAKAAAAGYTPAVRAKRDIENRGYVTLAADSTILNTMPPDPMPDESAVRTAMPIWSPVLLEFSRETQPDTLSTELLVDELLASRNFSAADSLSFTTLLTDHPDSTAWLRLARMSAWGNPEAMVLLGRFFSEGRHVEKNPYSAAGFFSAAVFLESPRAPALLIDVLRNSELPSRLPDRAWGGDAQAQYIWACLKAMDIDNRLSDSQAFDLLKRAAARGHAAATVQLGICYSTGRWVAPNQKRAGELWQQSVGQQQEEGRLRLAAATILGQQNFMDTSAALSILAAGAQEGSLIAEVALATSFERGFGQTRDIGEAARRYRSCAVRGSQTGWLSLRRMYDERRPADSDFHVDPQ